jgi:hypothetical protein
VTLPPPPPLLLLLRQGWQSCFVQVELPGLTEGLPDWRRYMLLRDLVHDMVLFLLLITPMGCCKELKTKLVHVLLLLLLLLVRK